MDFVISGAAKKKKKKKFQVYQQIALDILPPVSTFIEGKTPAQVLFVDFANIFHLHYG